MRFRNLFLILALGGFIALPVAAQTATQNVTVVVQEITAISVSAPVTLTINSVGSAGDNPDEATNSSSSYSITTNGSGKKITGEIDASFPTGISLAVNMQAPADAGASAGQVTLGTTPQDLVSGLTRVTGSDLEISYVASATVEAEPSAGETRTVTFTVTDS